MDIDNGALFLVVLVDRLTVAVAVRGRRWTVHLHGAGARVSCCVKMVNYVRLYSQHLNSAKAKAASARSQFTDQRSVLLAVA